MNAALPLMAGLLLLCLQVFLREAFALDAWTPDLLTALVLWLGSNRDWITGATLIALLGALADGFAGSPLGLHVVHGLLLFHAAALLAGQVRFQGPVGGLLLGIAGGFVSLFLLVLVSRLFLPETALPGRVSDLIVPRVTVIAVAVPILFPLLSRLDTLLSRRGEHDVL